MLKLFNMLLTIWIVHHVSELSVQKINSNCKSFTSPFEFLVIFKVNKVSMVDANKIGHLIPGRLINNAG